MSNPLCLLIDDEPDILELLVRTLKPMDIDCYTAETIAKAKEYLLSKSFDLCLTDMRLPDGNGIELVATIEQNYPNTPVAMITAYGNVESAVQTLKAGAFDFITKPIKLSELRNLVNSALKLSKQYESSTSNLTQSLPRIRRNKDWLSSQLMGQSKVMKNFRNRIRQLARSQAPITIYGESGTGKDVAARMIHTLGARADKPFIPVNCGAIPTELMESEFFGHKKGSFSGAYDDKRGLFQAADGGTLFLDEVAELPLPMQVKLLRAIQEKQIRAVGALQEIPVNVRLLSATHRNLNELVKQGKFRQDLFYRINVIELYAPSLREHVEDIPDFVANILKKVCSKNVNSKTDNPEPPHVSDKAIKVLRKYFFPGNVRELENILERAITLCENSMIDVKDLQLPSRNLQSSSRSFSLSHKQYDNSLDPLLENVEKETILNALKRAKGNKTKAAQILGINIGALRYRIRKFEINLDELII
ncbi:MAG: sigma-54-dependent Fis family transcriptional regulator [Thiomargarita sp.]|nr:sigma-54-dependent Fis family transcriptional regulator [Thiomargarita sp.]